MDIFRKHSITRYIAIVPFVFVLFMLTGLASAHVSNNINKEKSEPAKANNKNDYKLYKLNVNDVSITDSSDWKIIGTTNAPNGARLFATYGDETDDENYGVNASSSTDIDSWATVKNGNFTMYVNPLYLHYEKEYKSNTDIPAYLFAVTGLNGKLSKYNDSPNISNNLKNLISKNIDTTKLTLNDSQTNYYNNLGHSSSSSSSESEQSSSSSQVASSSSSVPTDYLSALSQADRFANRMYMSKNALYEQITSEYGSKFSSDAAQYAVDNVKTDWNKNALESAKRYQKMNMSTEDIREQLTSSSGGQFTQEQADYAVSNLPQ